MAEPRVTGIVLAAGHASRMGHSKLSLPLGDTNVIGWTLRNVEESALDDIVVVTGAHAEGLDLRPQRATIVHNPDPAGGSVTSLMTGIAVAGDPDAVMVLLGDSPEIDPPIIDHVLADFRRLPGWAAVTEYHDGIAHPYVLSKELYETLGDTTGDKVLWRILNDNFDKARKIRVPQMKPDDIDTWDDYVDVCDAFGVAPADRPGH